MWVKHALAALEALEAVGTEAEAFGALASYAEALGADLVSYHYRPPPLFDAEPPTEVLARGFPDAWVARYREERLHRTDPITSLAATRTRPFLWSRVEAIAGDLAPEQADYLAQLRAWLSPGDGLAVPAFGPSGQHGYFGIGSTRGIDYGWTPVQVRLVQGVCEAMHLRVCELRLQGLPPDGLSLSARETEILRGLASGRADWLIGGLVGLDAEGVRGRIRSLMRDLGVSDRPSLVLRARSLGLVD